MINNLEVNRIGPNKLDLPAGLKMTDNNVKVLIVDDRAAVRESLRTILSLEEDFEVVGEASSGSEAVEAARNLHPDLVLMDLEMPDAAGLIYDGVVACEYIKRDHLSERVVILTVHCDRASRERASLAGCDMFLEKGINTFELLEHLRQVRSTSQVKNARDI